MSLREDLAASMALHLDGTTNLYDPDAWHSEYVNEYLDAASALIREYVIHYTEGAV